MNIVGRWLSRWLVAYLSKEVSWRSVSTSRYEALQATLQPGDVLLVEGNTRISTAIKHLTQSTWTHAALYLGPDPAFEESREGEPPVLIEADLEEGIRAVPLSLYRHSHTRICRPQGLNKVDIERLTAYALARLGHRYDLKNIWDLARYLCPTPPVPIRYRRSMLALGSGDPTRAICSTFIAQGFQTLRYPILPLNLCDSSTDPNYQACEREYFKIRHHSLFVPRDFDASPYFNVLKPTLEQGFDYRHFEWAD